MTEREQRAYHEAGHAVAGLGRGIPLETLSLDADGGASSLWGGPEVYATEDEVKVAGVGLLLFRMRPYWVMRFAGMEGHRQYLEDAGHQVCLGVLESMATQDLSLVEEDERRLYKRGATLDDCLQLRREAWAEARALVQREWVAVQKVAAHLLARERLSGEDVRGVLADMTGDGDSGCEGREVMP